MADPILASNPLDPKTLNYYQLAEAYFALRAEASGEIDRLRAECSTNRALLDKAQAENVRLAEAARFENEKVRSLSASVEEWKKECRRLETLIPALVLREREECATLAKGAQAVTRPNLMDLYQRGWHDAADGVERAIRARGGQ